MKRAIITISLFVILAINGLAPVFGQDQPKPKKDTVNIDTDAKPTFYYSTEEENGASEGMSTGTIVAIIAGAVIVVGGTAFFLLKKK
jgi:hypothetical protein